MLAAFHFGQLLHVGEQAPRSHLRVPTGHSLEQSLVDEAVLVLGLHHVVPLGPHQGHVTVYVHSALMSNALQHCVDDNETTSATDTGAEMFTK